MTDVHSKQKRSYNMSRIRSKNTKPELLVRRYIFAKGFRYRLHDKKLIGKPDIVLPKYKTVIFIHGCFWHGHQQCPYFIMPKTRTEWWREKIHRTVEHDIQVSQQLSIAGWRIITIWECDLKGYKRERTLLSLQESLII
jgi:DNA mismatch endonuclease (patch repair protein)